MSERVVSIPIDKITVSPWQGRLASFLSGDSGRAARSFAELQESIRRSGVLQPVLVRAKGESLEIIDGHRRVAACKAAGMTEAPCLVRETGDREAQTQSIISNLQRDNLSPIELAIAYKKVLDTGLFPNKRELSSALGKDESYVGELINTLCMDERIIDDLKTNNSITDIRVLRAIRRMEPATDGVSEKQWEFFRRVVSEKLTRVQVLGLVKEAACSIRQPGAIRTRRGRTSLTVEIDVQGLTEKQIATLQERITDKARRLAERVTGAAAGTGRGRTE